LASLKNDQEWKDKLTPKEYAICRQKGTEAPFSGEYCDTKTKGVYLCKCCGVELFSSETKFDSGSGWPSFYEALNNSNVKTETDTTHGMERTEIMCAKCGCHLGHVFNDGPKPSGQRFCVNSASLKLNPE
jgi:peptide-methionine (R)-S-oxide reductase